MVHVVGLEPTSSLFHHTGNVLERLERIELTSFGWKPNIIPIYYKRNIKDITFLINVVIPLKLGTPNRIQTYSKNLEDSCAIHYTMGAFILERLMRIELISKGWKPFIITIIL